MIVSRYVKARNVANTPKHLHMHVMTNRTASVYMYLRIESHFDGSYNLILALKRSEKCK